MPPPYSMKQGKLYRVRASFPTDAEAFRFTHLGDVVVAIETMEDHNNVIYWKVLTANAELVAIAERNVQCFLEDMKND